MERLIFHIDVNSAYLSLSRQLFRELWDGKSSLRLMGLSLTGLTKGEEVQQSLFPDARREQNRRIDRATDAIQVRFGTGAIVRGSSLKGSLEVGKKHKAQLELEHKK